MKWTDKTSKNYTIFENLAYGDGFEKDNSLYIKVSADSAFDIIHNSWTVFHDETVVLPRDCEIVFY